MTNLQAIDLLKGLEQSLDDYCELNDEGKTAFRMAITALEVFGNSEQLPSAEPERKTAEWIYGENGGQDGWYCSECGGFIPWYYDFYGLDNIDFIEDFKTCPFCDSKMVSYTGADMREGEEE